jgi:L-lactate dehydrogenase complex protein LldG
VSNARERILDRVRRAREGRWAPGLPGQPWRQPADGDPVAVCMDNATASGIEVERFANPEEAAAWLQDWAGNFASAAVSPLLPTSLQPNLPPAPPEEAELGVSRALAAVATTGSVLLSSTEGRRLQLLPPAHLVFVDEGDVTWHLAEALKFLGEVKTGALALHSGPSKSADIGQIMVQGVHGPGRLLVAVVRGLAASSAGKPKRKRTRPQPKSDAGLDWRAVSKLLGETLKTKRREPFEVVKVTDNTVRVRVGSSGKEYTVRRASLEKAAALLAGGTEINGPAAYRKLVANEAPAYAWSLLREFGLV